MYKSNRLLPGTGGSIGEGRGHRMKVWQLMAGHGTNVASVLVLCTCISKIHEKMDYCRA